MRYKLKDKIKLQIEFTQLFLERFGHIRGIKELRMRGIPVVLEASSCPSFNSQGIKEVEINAFAINLKRLLRRHSSISDCIFKEQRDR